MTRSATISRKTKETQIDLSLYLDEPTRTELDTDLPFLTHMLNTLAVHGQLGLQVTAQGDIEVDPHHLIEDVGIVFGQALKDALTDVKTGKSFSDIQRAGHFEFPMDGTLAQVAIDLCGRGNLVWHVPPFESATVGHVDPRLFREFFKGVVDGSAMTLHVNVPYRDNDHHVVEAVFKAFTRALRNCIQPSGTILSTKGTLSD